MTGVHAAPKRRPLDLNILLWLYLALSAAYGIAALPAGLIVGGEPIGTYLILPMILGSP